MGAAAAGCQCSNGCGPMTEPSASGEEKPRYDVDGVAPLSLDKLKAASSKQDPEAAAKVQDIAKKSCEDAWSKLQAEFDVQKMVWQSMQMQRGFRHQGAVATLQSKIDYALGTREKDPAGALEAVEAAIEKNRAQAQDAPGEAETGGLLSNPLAKVLEVVAEAERLRPFRISLAEGLLHKGAELPSNIDDLVMTCKLGDPKLEKRVKRSLSGKSPRPSDRKATS
mmetsp:Transcript_39336/g.116585  ORF Transcript_39336/g.116585 Transcript_39336/m.116585 type:complete len:224 (-) Transcript_39336:122-793(-)